MPPRIFGLLIMGASVVWATGCPRSSGDEMQEVSANFDSEDVEPVLLRLANLVDQGFGPTDASALAAKITAQPVESEEEYRYRIQFQGKRTQLRIVAFMDDFDAPDIAFFTDGALAEAMNATIVGYMEEVGK